MFAVLGQLAAEARSYEEPAQSNAAMNRHLLSSALHEFTDSGAYGRRGSLASGLNLGHSKKRPKVEIHLDGQTEGFFVPSYTTRERIHGHVNITCAADVCFDDIHISLQGTTRTWVEKIATTATTNSRTRAFHTFLRLLQPIEESDVPEQHILRAGRAYKLPFEFVIPDRLLPQTCGHRRESPQVADEHLKLPPSMGDVMVAGDGKTLHCDLSPENTVIAYCVRCIITKKPQNNQTRPIILGDEQMKLRIVPQYDESPPLEISNEPGEDYIVEKRKTIKKGLLLGKTKIGTLHVESKQPAAMHLPRVRAAANSESVDPVQTMVTIKLRFDPLKAGAKPPKLQMLWSRLKVATFFSTVPAVSLPCKSANFSMDHNRGLFVETVPLSSRNLGGMAWTKQTSVRRDSGFALQRADSGEVSSPDEEGELSLGGSPATTPGTEDGPLNAYYTAEVLVPIELPSRKFAFVPTFHNCLISRVYALDMSLNLSAGSGNTTSVHLKVPVQVTSMGSETAVSGEGMTPEGGFVSARTEHRDVYAPVMAHGQGNDAPPEFDDIFPGQGRGAQRTGPSSNASDVDSDGELNIRRPAWRSMSGIQAGDPTSLACEFDRQHLEGESAASSPGAGASRAVSPTTRMSRNPSPRTRRTRLTNDEILNTEEYEQTPADEEQQFGSFRWEPVSFSRPGEGENRGEAANGEWRRASEALPPGYASVAAGTMLMGTQGMVRALN